MTQSQFEAAFAASLEDIGMRIERGDKIRSLSRQDVKDILDILGGQIQATLENEMPSVRAMQNGEKAPAITVRGVGRFAIRFRPAKPKRMGRNPATGEQIEIGSKPASRKLVVTPLRQMKEDLGVS